MEAQGRSRKSLLLAIITAAAFATLTVVFYLQLRASDRRQAETSQALQHAESELDLIGAVHDTSSGYQQRLAEKLQQLADLRTVTDSLKTVLTSSENGYQEAVTQYYAILDTARDLRKTESDVRQDIFAVKHKSKAIEDETQRIMLVDSLLLAATRDTKEAINKIRNRNQVLLNIKRDLESRLLTPLPLSEVLHDTLLKTFEQIYLAGAGQQLRLSDEPSEAESTIDYSDVSLEPGGDYVRLYEKDVLSIVAAHIELRQRFNARLANQIDLLQQQVDDTNVEIETLRSRKRELQTTIAALRTELTELEAQLSEHEAAFAAAREQYEADRQALNTTLLGYNDAYEDQLELFEVIGELQLALIRQKNQSVTEGTRVVRKPDQTAPETTPLPAQSTNTMVTK